MGMKKTKVNYFYLFCRSFAQCYFLSFDCKNVPSPFLNVYPSVISIFK